MNRIISEGKFSFLAFNKGFPSVFCFVLLILQFPFWNNSLAQYKDFSNSSEIDTNFIKSYQDQLIVRTYGITKYNRLSLIDQPTGTQFNYEPNSNVNFGLGFNYKWLGFNAAFNFPFVNDDDDKLGDTRSLDLQADIYGRKYLLNVIYQDYEGFRLTNNDLLIPQISTRDTIFKKRNDVNTRAFGINGFYNFNNKKFSYLSSFIQNEWQKKSAGSFFLGGYFSLLDLKADSSFIPESLSNDFQYYQEVSQANFTTLGVSGGYAHTFVFLEHFFITLSAAVGIGGEMSRTVMSDEDEVYLREASLSYATFTRGAIGYNEDSFHVGMSFSSNFNAYREQKITDVIYQFGNVRFYLVKRFQLGKGKKS